MSQLDRLSTNRSVPTGPCRSMAVRACFLVVDDQVFEALVDAHGQPFDEPSPSRLERSALDSLVSNRVNLEAGATGAHVDTPAPTVKKPASSSTEVSACVTMSYRQTVIQLGSCQPCGDSLRSLCSWAARALRRASHCRRRIPSAAPIRSRSRSPMGAASAPAFRPTAALRASCTTASTAASRFSPRSPARPGLMAVPGDAACRPVMPCGAGRWGDIAVDATTEYVDGAYTGGRATAAKRDRGRHRTTRWRRRHRARSSPSREGSYLEDVVVAGKPRAPRGRLPGRSGHRGHGPDAPTACAPAALCVVHRALTAPTCGASGSAARPWGCTCRAPSRCWSTGSACTRAPVRGIIVQDTLVRRRSPCGARSSEQSHEIGLYRRGLRRAHRGVGGARHLAARTDQTGGRGIVIRIGCARRRRAPCATRQCARTSPCTTRSSSRTTTSASSSPARTPASMRRWCARRRRSTGNPTRRRHGHQSLACHHTPMASCAIRRRARTASYAARSSTKTTTLGLRVVASDASIEASVVRHAVPSDQGRGNGIAARVAVQNSAVTRRARERHACSTRWSSRTTTSASSSRTRTRASRRRWCAPPRRAPPTEDFGVRHRHPGRLRRQRSRGAVCDPAARSNATVRGSLVEQNHARRRRRLRLGRHRGLSVVRATSPRALRRSHRRRRGGVQLRRRRPPLTRVARPHRRERPRGPVRTLAPSPALGSTHIRCAAFELAGERYEEQDFIIEDRGDNLCGCPAADHACKAVSAGLEPPDPPGQ